MNVKGVEMLAFAPFRGDLGVAWAPVWTAVSIVSHPPQSQRKLRISRHFRTAHPPKRPSNMFILAHYLKSPLAIPRPNQTHSNPPSTAQKPLLRPKNATSPT